MPVEGRERRGGKSASTGWKRHRPLRRPRDCCLSVGGKRIAEERNKQEEAMKALKAAVPEEQSEEERQEERREGR